MSGAMKKVTVRPVGGQRCSTKMSLWGQQQWSSLLFAVMAITACMEAVTAVDSTTSGQQSTVLRQTRASSSALSAPSLTERDMQSSIEVGAFATTEDLLVCYNRLNASDTNPVNSEVDNEEYVTFARLMSPPGLLGNISTFAELPVAFQLAFTETACLCEDPQFGGQNASCCQGDNAHIDVPPVFPEVNTTQRLYLRRTCAYTETAVEIVERPTAAPVSSAPTRAPTLAPATPVPTATPTTRKPTGLPTQSPTTASPTQPPPTATPTIPVPTVTPTTAAPTPPRPTMAPTPPVPLVQVIPINVTYEILVANGQAQSSNVTFINAYRSDLIGAMDALSVTVADEVNSVAERNRNRQLRRTEVSSSTSTAVKQRRRLTVGPQLPTQLAPLVDIDCPSQANAQAGDLCQNAPSTILLQLFNESNPQSVAVLYKGVLDSAIRAGQLQQALDGVNPDSPVTVLDDSLTVAPQPVDTGLSPGATAGVVIGVLFVLILPIAYNLYKRQKERRLEANRKSEYLPFEQDHSDKDSDLGKLGGGEADIAAAAVAAEAGAGEKSGKVDKVPVGDKDVYTDEDGAVQMTAATLGAKDANYGRASKKALEAMAAGEDMLAEPAMDVAPDSSSNAGSSGWSSSAGLSSQYTGSVDDSMDAAAAAGATLAAIGASSALSRKLEEDRKSALLKEAEAQEASEEEISRSQLDSLIEAGDWAAVGATAALLAAASDSETAASGSKASGSGSKADQSADTTSMDAARAAELDNLVDAGDWEGVVLAAAKFEAAESSAQDTDSKSGASRGSHASQSGDGTGTGTGGSTLTSEDDTAKAQRLAEIRAEVETLVRRVVPDEIDNVDEMMKQFEGREDELIETLRTMQERSVAQKAREATQKAAKSEARRSVKREREAAKQQEESGEGISPGEAAAVGVGTAAAVGAAAGAVAAATSKDDSDKSPDSGEGSSAQVSSQMDTSMITEESDEVRKSALERAIEAGDWEAVGEAAAMMSDASVTTASSGGLDRLADAMSATSSSVGRRSGRSLEGIDAERAAELDDMIDRGDWTGVVEATKRYKQTEAEQEAQQQSAPTEEEEEALREAEAWMRIAEQKKAEGATDAAASEAAEWAIKRSLEQLQQKEQVNKGGGGDDQEEDEV